LQKNKRGFLLHQQTTVGPLQFGFTAVSDSDLFVTRIKKIFSKIDKISVLQPVTEKLFSKIFTCFNANLQNFSIDYYSANTVLLIDNFIFAKNDTL